MFLQGSQVFDGTGLPSLSLAYPGNVTVGNLLLIAAGVDTLINLSVTDSLGSAYQSAIVTDGTGALATFRDQIFYAKAAASGACTVTLNLSGADARTRLLIHEYSLTTEFDAAAGANGLGGLIDSGATNTAHANELIFGWGISNAGTTVAGAGFTLRETCQLQSSEDMTSGAVGAYHATYPDDANPWICQVATFATPSPGGTGAPSVWFYERSKSSRRERRRRRRSEIYG